MMAGTLRRHQHDFTVKVASIFRSHVSLAEVGLIAVPTQSQPCSCSILVSQASVEGMVVGNSWRATTARLGWRAFVVCDWTRSPKHGRLLTKSLSHIKLIKLDLGILLIGICSVMAGPLCSCPLPSTWTEAGIWVLWDEQLTEGAEVLIVEHEEHESELYVFPHERGRELCHIARLLL